MVAVPSAACGGWSARAARVQAPIARAASTTACGRTSADAVASRSSARGAPSGHAPLGGVGRRGAPGTACRAGLSNWTSALFHTFRGAGSDGVATREADAGADSDRTSNRAPPHAHPLHDVLLGSVDGTGASDALSAPGGGASGPAGEVLACRKPSSNGASPHSNGNAFDRAFHAAPASDAMGSGGSGDVETYAESVMMSAIERNLNRSFGKRPLLPPAEPMVVVISGPSGVGKDAVIRRLQEKRGDEMHFVVTATTRPMREGEVDGVDYIFTDAAEFERLIENGDLLEHAIVYGEYKGIPKQQVRKALAKGTDVVLRLDVQG